MKCFEGFADVVSEREVGVLHESRQPVFPPHTELGFISRPFSTLLLLPKPPINFPGPVSQSSRWFWDEMGRAEIQEVLNFIPAPFMPSRSC